MKDELKDERTKANHIWYAVDIASFAISLTFLILVSGSQIVPLVFGIGVFYLTMGVIVGKWIFDKENISSLETLHQISPFASAVALLARLGVFVFSAINIAMHLKGGWSYIGISIFAAVMILSTFFSVFSQATNKRLEEHTARIDEVVDSVITDEIPEVEAE